ncbi:uncharacterized protein LOC133449507 [Cololabis saira]|uniref:uncharacterized protein LOC133449507 n=1 Tax=Cololabis saira TaxID=129043 RepID=UPI002AD2D167|nr:uncharacterized protein LOC133449507 [Cololabis saira]
MHHSIFPSSEDYKVERCTVCCKLFHCPLCPKYKPSQRGRLHKHLDVHCKNAITFKDQKICKCSLNCRSTSHFHCPICDKTIIRRADMEKHLETCQILNTSAAPNPLLLPPSTLPQDVPCAPPTTSSTAQSTTSSTAQSTNSSTAQSTNSSTAQPTTSSTAQPTNSSTAQPTTSSTAQSTNSSTAQSTNSSTAQSTNSSTAQSTNSSTAQSTTSFSIQHTTSYKKAKCSHCGLISIFFIG